MARPKGSGINVVSKKRPDGTILRYFYDRASKTFLGHDREAAEKRVRQDAAVLPSGIDPHDRSLSAAISLYIGTAAFKRLAARTQETYRNDLEWLRENYGDIHVRSFRPGSIERIKLLLEPQPYKANNTLAVLRIVLGLAVKLEWLPSNPAASVSRVTVAPRTQIWTREDEERFERGARWELQLAMMLLLYTVQRPSDVLAMTLGQVTERAGRLWIRLRQAKTDELVDVPVHSRLAPALRARMARKVKRVEKGKEVISTLLVPSPRGHSWTRRNFSRAWDEQQRRAARRLARELLQAGMKKGEARVELADRHRQRRDFRRTGVVRLAEAGATTPQIAAISGHRIDRCQKIIDTYLPRRGEVALGGIEAWEGAAERVVLIKQSGR